jgi:hypothetical protein
MNGKRVGLYLRVSTGEQTIETQRMGLVAACEARAGESSRSSRIRGSAVLRVGKSAPVNAG